MKTLEHCCCLQGALDAGHTWDSSFARFGAYACPPCAEETKRISAAIPRPSPDNLLREYTDEHGITHRVYKAKA